jgi:hypothetical protein
MKTKIVFEAFLKPSATINFTLLPEGWEQLIGGTDSKFATGISRYYEGLKIVFSSVAEEVMIQAFLTFIHPALRHEFGDVLGYYTFDNKIIHVLVYTPERVVVSTWEPMT